MACGGYLGSVDMATYAGRPCGAAGRSPRSGASTADLLPVKRAALAEPLGVGLHGLAVGGGIRGSAC